MKLAHVVLSQQFVCHMHSHEVKGMIPKEILSGYVTTHGGCERQLLLFFFRVRCVGGFR